ncbi:MAG: type III pantothenate kinase [Planctomycetota bacterium]
MPASTNLLAVALGNSRLRLGTFVDGKLAETNAQPLGNPPDLTAHFAEAITQAYQPIKGRDGATILLTSTNPAATPQAEQLITQTLGQPFHRVEVDVNIPLGRQLDREALVGEDRLLNAAAAYDVLQQACMVIDAGTAITLDFVDGAGTFHGGAIAPGAQLMLDALDRRFPQLPPTDFARPDEPIGHNTPQAMLSGTFHGLRGMARELLEQFADATGQFPLVVATGGDADLLFREWDLIDRVVPDLTLMGLQLTARKAAEQAEEA